MDDDIGLLARLRSFRRGLGTEFTVADAAEHFVKIMADEHPAELADWQQSYTVTFVADALRHMLQSDRAKALARHGARAFDDQRQDAGDDMAFAQAYCVDDTHLWRRVADMTGDDHRYVADQYELRGRRQLTLAEFHRAVAKKVGKRHTSEAFTEAQYDALLAKFLP